MFLREIALKALRRAGIARGENVPADRFGLAVESVVGALRYYSDNDTISCFAAHRTVHLDKETTVGAPTLKRGCRLHCVSELPSLASYQPNDGSWVIGRDFWYVDNEGFYTIAQEGTSYVFTSCEQSAFATTTVDIYCKDIAKVVALFGSEGKLNETKLSSFFGYGSGVFVSTVDGNGRLKIYVKEPGDYEMVYTRSMVFNENTQVDLPATQEELIVAHVAYGLCRSSEKKSELKRELDTAISNALDSAMDEAIPTRSEW